ncbi:MAG: RluA family pseudouridine synthase [Treponemataceae bacterium]
MKRTPPFTIVHEDADVLIVNKAAGVAVLADRWDDSKERLDDLLNVWYADRIAADLDAPAPIPFPHRVFVVHRIDRDTSGLVIFAKNADAHKALSSAFESRRVQKTYIAAVHGTPAWKETLCDLPLRLDGDREHRTVIDKGFGKHAITTFRVLGTYGNISIVEAQPETGRTHQIRVHLAALGHAIVADSLYGDGKPLCLSAFKRGWRGDPYDERPLIDRLALHAARLGLPVFKPAEREIGPFNLIAPFPRDFTALITQLEKAAGEDFGLGDYR